MVPTVVDRQATVVALPQAGLITRAPYVIQEDGAKAVTKQTVSWGRQGHPTAQLLAHHLGGGQAPEVITHGPPCAVVLELHAALTPALSIGQPHYGQICRSQEPSQHEKVL